MDWGRLIMFDSGSYIMNVIVIHKFSLQKYIDMWYEGIAWYTFTKSLDSLIEHSLIISMLGDLYYQWLSKKFYINTAFSS